MSRPPVHAYVHVPFCRARCRYCDFVSSVGSAEAMDDYLEGLELELRSLSGRLGLRTLYVGGGTPTALPQKQLERFLTLLRARFRLDALEELEEFTFEANPGTVAAPVLETLLRAGVNRVSVGIQTFDDRLLRLLGRVHDAAAAHAALHALRTVGFQNLSVDLIYGIPGCTETTWRRDLEQALEHEPEHLSTYGLTIEQGTIFHRWATDGRLNPTSDDAMADLFEITHEVLTAAGYVHYEISNYARPGQECRHNQATWRYSTLLGLGPGAAGFRDGERTRNVTSTSEYLLRLRAGESPVEERERLDPARAAGEALMLALRTAEGVTAGEILRRHGIDPLVRFRRPIGRFRKMGLLEVKRRRIRLTTAGWLVADEILGTFLGDDGSRKTG